MIMDGLDTLSRVALADQLNIGQLSFDITPTGSQPVPAQEGPRVPTDHGLDNLNTPVTTSSDVNFNFVNSDIEITHEPLPITGRCLLPHIYPRNLCLKH